MIAETALVCWLIACVFLPLLWALTSSPPAEVRRVTNALVIGQVRRIVRADDMLAKYKRNFPDVARYMEAHEGRS